MDLINSTVRHKIFGEGKICEWNESVFSVRFRSGVKKFIFPDAFMKHLILTEKSSKQFVKEFLNKKELELKEEREAEEKRIMLKNLPVYTNSQAAFAFLENKKQDVLDNGIIFAGNYRSGYNRGKPRTPKRIYPNSACLLTYRDKDDSEENRFIWGVFMVKEDFIGSDCSDGMIPAHDKYRIILSKDERKDLKYWDYFKEPEKSAKWGTVEIKYFSNIVMTRILKDILIIKRGTKDQQLCEEFLNYYFMQNKLNKEQVSDLYKEQSEIIKGN